MVEGPKDIGVEANMTEVQEPSTVEPPTTALDSTAALTEDGGPDSGFQVGGRDSAIDAVAVPKAAPMKFDSIDPEKPVDYIKGLATKLKTDNPTPDDIKTAKELYSAVLSVNMGDPVTRDALVAAKIEHLDPVIKFHQVSEQIQNILGIDELMPEHKEIIYGMLKNPVLAKFLEGAISKTQAAKSNASKHNMLAATKFIKSDDESLINSFFGLYGDHPEVQDFIDGKNKQVKSLLTAMGVASTSIMNSQFATQMSDPRTTKCFPEYSAAMKPTGKFPDGYHVSKALLNKYKSAHAEALKQGAEIGLPVDQTRFSWSGMNPSDGMLVMAERFKLADGSGKDRIVIGVMHNDKVSLQALDLDPGADPGFDALKEKIESAHRKVYF